MNTIEVPTSPAPCPSFKSFEMFLVSLYLCQQFPGDAVLFFCLFLSPETLIVFLTITLPEIRA